jgi:hypothetical protein
MVVYFVAAFARATENPKSNAQTRAAKPNSTRGKKVKASINSSTRRKE